MRQVMRALYLRSLVAFFYEWLALSVANSSHRSFMAAGKGVVVRVTAETRKTGWLASVSGIATTLSDGKMASSVK